MTDHNNTFGASMNKALKDDGDDFLNLALKKWKFSSKCQQVSCHFMTINSQIWDCGEVQPQSPNLSYFNLDFINYKLNYSYKLLVTFFIAFGTVFTVYYTKIKQIKQQYDNKCKLNEVCNIEISITDHMSQPIYFYYELDNFYQTNRKFYQSKDNDQLKGEDRSVSQLSKCSPFVTNSEMGKTQSYAGFPLNPQDPAIPCGLLAKLYFNDSFSLFYQNGTEVNIDTKSIAWSVDVDYNYKQTDNAAQKAWVDVTDEHFMVWMRTSGMGTFKKLWGRIREDLPPGQYNLKINNQYNTTEYNGQKSFTITTSTPFGQKNIVLIVAYFSGAAICLFSCVSLYFFNRAKKDK